MPYSVKEIYFTIQGEGFHSGRSAVFCRFSGCNLWSGTESDRKGAKCWFCDTDFVGTNGPNGARYESAEMLANKILEIWSAVSRNGVRPFVVCTGGEPLLQMDLALVDALHELNFEVAVETNGTICPPAGIDWICVSPKSGSEIKIDNGNELKLVYPQAGIKPEDFDEMEFVHRFLMPMDCKDTKIFTADAIEYCKHHPSWRLTLQLQKTLGLP